MPGYINAALHKYQHPAPVRTKHAPHMWNPPVYGTTTQCIEEIEDIPYLSPKEVNSLQQLGGTLLYYTRVVYPTVIMPGNVLASKLSRVTAETADKLSKCSIIAHHIRRLHYTNIRQT
jgi:hypothetical protein